MNIFKLYYYEIKKNKKLFMLMIFLSLAALLYYVFYSLYDKNGSYLNIISSKKLVEEAIALKLIPLKVNSYFTFGSHGIIDKNILTDINITLLMMTLVLVSILLSSRMVTRNYSRKNKSFMIETFLPVKLYEIKVARVLAGLSLYMVTSVLGILILTTGNVILKFVIGDFLNSSDYALNGITLMNMFLPFGVKSTLEITFVFVLTCVIGVQSLSSIFLADIEKKNRVRNRVLYTIVMIAAFLLMGSYLFILAVEASFQGSYTYIFGHIRIIDIYNIVFVIMSLSLFLIDLKISRNRMRGGF